MLPYTQVQYIFGTSSVSPALQTYYGCIMGKATILHDLESHGWFPPQADDCGGGEGTTTASYDGLTFRDGRIAINPEGTDDRLPYPKFTKGNTVDSSTVKTYFKNLKTVSIFDKNMLVLPVDANCFRLAQDSGDEETVTSLAQSLFVVNPSNPSELKVSVPSECTFDLTTERKVMIPGTLELTITAKVGEEAEESFIFKDADSETGAAFHILEMNEKEGYTCVSTITYEFDSDQKFYKFKGAIVINNSVDTPLIMTGITEAKCSYANYAAIEELLIGTGITDKMAFGAVAVADSASSTESGTEDPGTEDPGTEEPAAEESDSSASFFENVEELRGAFLDLDGNASPAARDQKGFALSITSIDRTSGIIRTGSTIFADKGDYSPRTGFAVIRSASQHPVRFDAMDASEASTFDPATGEIVLELEELVFGTRDYDYNDTKLSDPYLGHYDTDPSDEVLRPAIEDVGCNFISGDLRIEYSESVTSPVRTGENGLYRTDLLSADENIEEYIGQMDPRNQLGFAYGFVRQITSAELYVLACTDLKSGEGTLEKYRNIFHVWYVSDAGYSSDFDSWIDKENQKEQSRFRIGYQFCPIDDSIVRIPSIGATFRVEESGAYTINKEGAGFQSTYGVAAGDTVKCTTDNKTYTVYSASDDLLTLVESYNADSEYSKHKAVLDPETGDYVYVADRNVVEGQVSIKIAYVTDAGITKTVSGLCNGEPAEDTPFYDIIQSVAVSGTEITVTPATDANVVSCKVAFKYADYQDNFTIYKVYNSDEKAQHMVDIQSSSNMADVLVLTKNIKYSSSEWRSALDRGESVDQFITSDSVASTDFTFLPDYAAPGLIFGTKLATQPHMPLTLVTFNIPGIGEVMGMRDFTHDNLELMLGAGYCMLNSEIGGVPFCETDCTAGYKYYGDSDRGLLSKITPVLMYGKDVYQVTKDWKGPMNTGTPELINGLGMSLVVLKKKYTETKYNMLGTLLRSVSDAQIAFDGSYIVITHHISSQDPARYIDNIIYAELITSAIASLLFYINDIVNILPVRRCVQYVHRH